MNETVKVLMGRVLVNMQGEPMRMGADAATVNLIMSAIDKAQLSDIPRRALGDALNKALPPELTLVEVVCTSLLAAFEDEKQLAATTRVTRNTLAQRLNRTGRCKVSRADRDMILPLVEKCYAGSLVYPQAEVLLQGKEWTSVRQDGDEPDEASPLRAVAAE